MGMVWTAQNIKGIQEIEPQAINAVAEAVRGLARDRSLLVKELRDTSKAWREYDEFASKQAAKIEAIDRRIDMLVGIAPPVTGPSLGGGGGVAA